MKQTPQLLSGIKMKKITRQKLIHRFFQITIIGKGIDGLLEIVGGVLLIFFSHARINRIVTWLTQHELSEDPHDFIANHLIQMAHSLSVAGQIFIAIYLLSHGIIKLVLIIALLRRKLWAYPLAIVFFALFIIYQMYRYALSQSFWMLALSILDLIVILLTWLEYRRLKAEIAMA
jgi:uncharacterized membrane protein